MNKKDYTLFFIINSALSVTLFIATIILYVDSILLSISICYCINIAIQYYFYKLNKRKGNRIHLTLKNNTYINLCFIIPLVGSCSLVYWQNIDAYSTKGILIVLFSFLIGTLIATIYGIRLMKKQQSLS